MPRRHNTPHGATLPSCCVPTHTLDVIHGLLRVRVLQYHVGSGCSERLEVRSSPSRVRQEHFPSPDLITMSQMKTIMVAKSDQ